MTDIKKIIKDFRPELKDNTIHQYYLQLTKLQKLFDTENFDFLNNPSDVEKKTSHLHYTSQRNAYNAVVLYLLATNSDKKIIDEYGKMRDALNKKYEDDQASGKISAKQSKNFVELSEVADMIKKMYDEVKTYKKLDKLKRSQDQLLKAFVIYSILIRNPTRNDQAGMILIGKSMYNKLTEDDKKEHNYLLNEKGNMKFIYNEYKTSKKYAENIVDIQKPLEKILRMYIRIMKLKNGDILFDMTKNAQSQMLISMSEKYMGKRISSTMLRKIYLSSKYGSTISEMKEDAKNMMHSPEVAQKVYIKEK